METNDLGFVSKHTLRQITVHVYEQSINDTTLNGNEGG